METLKPETELSEVSGFGPRFLAKLKRLGITTVEDLLFHFPIRYEDWSEFSPIASLNVGDEKTIKGVVQDIKISRSWRKRMIIIEALVSDNSGSIRVVWFNQPYIKNILKKGSLVNFSGKVSLKDGKIYLSSPIYELINKNNSEGGRHTGRLVPIYPETKGLTSKGLRLLIERVFENLEEIPEFIPHEVLKANGLPGINTALKQIHYPEEKQDAELGRRRFAFEELFLLQLKNILQRITLAKESARTVQVNGEELQQSLEKLPFELTSSQKKALGEILKDLAEPHPMNRLLQGDVGSGKTIVAGIAAKITAKNYQVAFMAPTEILARQHYQTLTKFFSDFEGGIGLLVSKETKEFFGDKLERKETKSKFLKDITSGKIKIVVGTHALIQKGVAFKNLGLLIVDEQHRFGVSQRAELLRDTLSRQNVYPHLLSMSATPIPRTLMLSIFGDLNLSLIEELPQGRRAIITKLVDPENRAKAYAFIRGQVRRGRQVFVICPRIEPVEMEVPLNKEDFQKLDVKAAKEEYEKLSQKIFPDLKVALLHGKMKSTDKEAVMSDFANGKTDILVTTSVVEVGVDVPNATIMMIEGAERFGLAQLYQFRGRVGRGEYQSFSFLFTESSSRQTHQRLEALLSAKNGFELAETDLRFRGPGEFLGESQTGLPDIAMKALQNPNLIKTARAAAEKIIDEDQNLKIYPLLKEKLKQFQKEIHLE